MQLADQKGSKFVQNIVNNESKHVQRFSEPYKGYNLGRCSYGAAFKFEHECFRWSGNNPIEDCKYR